MKKILVLSSLLAVGLISCTNSKKEIDKVAVAKQYYTILDNSDTSGIAAILSDSLLTKETEYDYEQTFSLQEYVEWLQWDSLFNPTYEILEIEQDSDMVKATISKMDKRILFLHKEPIVTNQIIRFTDDKISSVETTKYVIFNDSTFVENRGKLLSWVDENHPELNEFIYDQTKEGGLRYLKAIELFEKGK